MTDLQKYIKNRKERDSEFAKNFEEGYQSFKIGVLLKQAREQASLTQSDLAKKLKIKKAVISKVESHSEDIKLSVIEKIAFILGKRIEITINNY